MSRVLAVDWGSKRIGLAVSDPTGLLARPLPTLAVTGAGRAAREVAAVARREEADLVLVGLPLNMDGSEGASAKSARKLGAALAGDGLAVRYLDERLTSEDAVRALRERGERRPDKTRIDQMAALLLLTDYLEASARDARRPEGRDA